MFERIKPVFRSQVVAEQIVRTIRGANLKIGDKLATEREMANSMDVSRNTLREAIAMLQVAGVLEVKRSSGIFVASLPDDENVRKSLENAGFLGATDTHEAIDARIAMEPGSGILASRNASEKDWATFDALINKMRDAIQKGDIETYRNYDNELHRSIAESTRNEVIISTLIPIIETAREPLWSAIKEGIYNVSVLQSSLDEHCRIVEAMRTGDEYFIYRAFRTHLEKSKARLDIDID